MTRPVAPAASRMQATISPSWSVCLNSNSTPGNSFSRRFSMPFRVKVPYISGRRCPRVPRLTPLRTKILVAKDGPYRPVGLGDVYRNVPSGAAHVFEEDESERVGLVGSAALLVAAHGPQDRF